MSRVLALALAALFFGSCTRESEAAVWLGAIDDAHGALESASSRDAKLEAMDTLEALIEPDAPTYIARNDARTVRQDAYYVLASTALSVGDPYAARRFATSGLQLGQRKDVLVTNLLVARGEALEMLGEPQRAATDYHRALVMASEMLDERLSRVGGSTP